MSADVKPEPVLWGWPDDEDLHHDSAEAVVSEMLFDCMGDWETDAEMRDYIACLESVTVDGFAHHPKPSAALMHHRAQGLAEYLQEWWWDNWGNCSDPFDNDEALARDMEALVARYVARAEVWRCSKVAEQTFTSAEMLELYELNGGWCP